MLSDVNSWYLLHSRVVRRSNRGRCGEVSDQGSGGERQPEARSEVPGDRPEP